MASASARTSTPPRPEVNLEAELTCSICTELLYRPLTLLDCLHTFCAACAKSWFAWQAEAAAAAERASGPPASYPSTIATCPACRDPVRGTRHDARVNTLLEMFLAIHPDKARSAQDREDMDAKYTKGENIVPKPPWDRRTAEQRRLDEQDRRLVEEVREMSLREATGSGAESGAASRRPAGAQVRLRSRDGRGVHSGNRHLGGGEQHSAPSLLGMAGRERRQSRDRSRRRETSDEDSEDGVYGRRHHSRQHSSNPYAEENRRRRRRSAEMEEEYEAQESQTQLQYRQHQQRHVAQHQSSLRSLISSSAMRADDSGDEVFMSAQELEREIADFARQIQEEGLLNGVDLDQIDLSNNEELSQKITEAYRRRQQQRGKDPSRQRHHRQHSHQHQHRPSGEGLSTADTTRRSHDNSRSPGAPTTTAQAAEHRSAPALAGTLATPAESARGSSRPATREGRLTVRPRSRQRAQSGEPGTRRDANEERGRYPPPSSTHLEVQDPEPRRRRRRTTSDSGPRGIIVPAASAPPTEVPTGREAADRVQTDPVTRLTRPAGLTDGSRTNSLPSAAPPSSSLQVPASPPSHASSGLSFSARAAAGMGAPGPASTGVYGSQAPTRPEARQHSSSQPASPTSKSFGGRRGGGSRLAEAPASNGAQQLASSSAFVSPGGGGGGSFSAGASRAALAAPATPQFPVAAAAPETLTLPSRYKEPLISCARCGRENIEYEIHYTCGDASCRHPASAGNSSSGSSEKKEPWTICQDCWRRRRGCLWRDRWEQARKRGESAAAIRKSLGLPHALRPARYLRPRRDKILPPRSGHGMSSQADGSSSGHGGHAGRAPTLTSESPAERRQEGTFCATCSVWTGLGGGGHCYWKCEACNDGDSWGFCSDCVNQGRCCTHPLLAAVWQPAEKRAGSDSEGESSSGLRASPKRSHPAGTLVPLAATSLPPSGCELCGQPIPPLDSRYHCSACVSRRAGSRPGEHDMCERCYEGLVADGRVAEENGPAGWRRCLQGHRMVVVAYRSCSSGRGDRSGRNNNHEAGAGRNSSSSSSSSSSGRGDANAEASGGDDGDTFEWRRCVLRARVGGARLAMEPCEGRPGMQVWHWFEDGKDGDNNVGPTGAGNDGGNATKAGTGTRLERLVSLDVGQPTTAGTEQGDDAGTFTDRFPPDGGGGLRARARWGWWPAADVQDELSFPRVADIWEIDDVNGEWFFGVCMGKQGLFPAPYVRVSGM